MKEKIDEEEKEEEEEEFELTWSKLVNIHLFNRIHF